MSVQKIMWDKVKGTSKNIYVSNPAHGGGLHNYGLAVDVSILDADGVPLSMGVPVDHMGKESHISYEDEMVRTGKLTEEERENRHSVGSGRKPPVATPHYARSRFPSASYRMVAFQLLQPR